MEINQHHVTVDTVEISYYRAGTQGKPVVLLHGGGTDSAMLSWREALPALAEEFQVYAPDWPGYGSSQEIQGDYTIDRLVEFLHGLMKAWGLEKASLVGLSMGGGAALGFALAHPGMVDKLVLVDSYGLQKQAPRHRLSYIFVRLPFLMKLTWQSIRKDKGMARAALRSIFASPDTISDEMVDELFQAVQNPSGERSFYAFQRYEMGWKGLRTNFVSRLGEIRSPVLFIHGDKDLLVPIDEVLQAAKTMPRAVVKVMENTGHWAPREHPEQFNRLVSHFLKGIELPELEQVEHEHSQG